MKFPQLFLGQLSSEQKDFLNLLELTAKVHGENKISQISQDTPIWSEEFFHLENSQIWKSLSVEVQKQILLKLGHKILQEAYFIECAGMAYAAKMNLAAKSKEEREFYCFVGEEEARHLRMVEGLGNFETNLENIPSFALLIGEIIQEAKRASHLLLIQILLEGWGLNYYKSLQKNAKNETVSNIFKAILKDEIRHHSAGVLLFGNLKKSQGLDPQNESEFLSFFERIAFMVKAGPWNVCEEVFKHIENPSKDMLHKFLVEIEAGKFTSEKMDVLEQLITKALPESSLKTVKEKGLLNRLTLDEMTEVLASSIP